MLKETQGVGTQGDPAVEVLEGLRQVVGALGLVCREGSRPLLFRDAFLSVVGVFVVVGMWWCRMSMLKLIRV